VTDEPAGPTRSSTASPPPPPPPPSVTDWQQPTPPTRKRVSRWWWVALGLVVVLFVGAAAGFWIRLPYYTISPGGELPVSARVSVSGAKTYRPKGDVLLLFVRERARVNVWRYIQAKLDSEIDIYPEQQFTGGQSPAEIRAGAVADMAASQIAAKKVALEEVGYDVPVVRRGVVVLATVPGRPADGPLQQGDVILSVDGKPITSNDALSTQIHTHKPGEKIVLEVDRDGHDRRVSVGTQANKQGEPEIGVIVSPQYKYPIDVKIDTSDIGGPSAGLAMTLAIIDNLTRGNLTGGKKVAVTGTIAPDGTVGEIGGISQKAVAVRAAHATLFIVPKCTDPQGKAACEKDLAQVRAHSGDTQVVAVANLDEALAALRKAGGDPVERVEHAA
jgi:PDZ domain-containing protein